MSAFPCHRQWGLPSASKRVFLIHAITSSSQVWDTIARDFASRGYSVTAPDLLGHGNARRSSLYSITALAEELHPFFTTSAGNDHPYHVIIGHSLGGIVATALLPFLRSSRPVRVVLIDPPLEQTPESVASARKIIPNLVRSPKTPDDYLEEHPLWTREDAILESASVRLCDVTAVEAILDQNVPWSFSRNLATVPDNVTVTVLTGTPSKVNDQDLAPFPHVTRKTVWGASHWIPFEFPRVVVETALDGVESQNERCHVVQPSGDNNL